MIFTEKTWVDRSTQYPTRRTLTDTTTGTVQTVDVARAEGDIYSAGDALDATNLNGLEGRIASAFASVESSVVEYGSDDVWTWVKYENGFAICAGQDDFSFTGNTAWAEGWYYSATTGANFPFTWAAAPCCWVEKGSLDGMDILTISKGASTTVSPSMRAAKPGAYSGTTTHTICILAVGRWK